MTESGLYFYKAMIVAVYDGDTCTADIDLGLNIWLRGEKLRLMRINAPELRGATIGAGKASRDYLKSLILEKVALIQTVKDRKEKYGRYLAEMWLVDADGKRQNVNDLMVSNGFAIYQEY
jgi:micrococcal nuclease